MSETKNKPSSTEPPDLRAASPLVAVVMGSKSDWETMRHADEILTQFEVPHECRIVSAKNKRTRCYGIRCREGDHLTRLDHRRARQRPTRTDVCHCRAAHGLSRPYLLA